METEGSVKLEVGERNEDRHQSNEFAVSLAVVWMASRRDVWVVEAQQSADRPAFMKALHEHEASWRKPMIRRMAYTVSRAELELELDLASGALQATGNDLTGTSGALPREAWSKDLFLDAARDCALDGSGVIAYTDLQVGQADLFKRYEPRDAFARRTFQRSVWNAAMTAHWIEERTSQGFYDNQAPLGPVNDGSRFYEALRTGQIKATIDRKVVPRDTWFAVTEEALRKAQFKKIGVVAAFPYIKNPHLERQIVEYLNTLPENTTTSFARNKLKKRFDNMDATINRLVSACPHLRVLPRGRQEGSKNIKGREKERKSS